MAVPPHSPKALLRRELKTRRQAFVSNNDIQRCARSLAATAMGHIDRAGVVAAYWPIGSEADPRPLIEMLFARGARIALPHVTHAADSLRFLAWTPGAPLEDGLFGLRQPPADAPEAKPDVILTPLLGFDRALNRIGYGAGHYDRAFARFPDARRIGLAWGIQACNSILVDPWDVPLHAVATENEWIEE